MTVQPPSPPYRGPAKWHGADNNKPINRIVVHATDGTEPGVAGAAEGTVRGSKATSRPSSFHYVADSKVSLQYVYDSVVAYHAPPNEHSIGYELCCDLSDEGKGHWTRPDHVAMLDIAAADIARLCLAYDVPIVKLTVDDLKAGKHGLCGHIDVSNAWHETTHWDPGPYFPWADFIGKVKAAAAKLQETPDPVPNGRRLKVGTFNLLRGRSPATVLHEVIELVDRHNIIALAVQEAEGYFDALSRLRDFDYFADPGNPENGILVIEGRGSNFYTHEVGDGWVREGGAKRGPGEFPRLTVDDWCRIGSTHWPPDTIWRDGQLVAPPERVDDVREWAEACQRFLSLDGARVLLGDNNERAKTRGHFSPGWVAEQTGAKIGSTGAIDWGMGVGCHFENVVESNSPEKSDHEPQVMDVVEA